jgi:hypothetical protein
MTARPTRLLKACDWREELEHAIREQVKCERDADGMLQRHLDAANPYLEERRNALRAAKLMEAQAWAEYARRAETAFRDVAAVEIVRVDQAERRARYDGDAA